MYLAKKKQTVNGRKTAIYQSQILVTCHYLVPSIVMMYDGTRVLDILGSSLDMDLGSSN